MSRDDKKSSPAATVCGGGLHQDEPMKTTMLLAMTLALAACGTETQSARIAVIQSRLAATNVKDFDTWASLHTANACRTAPELEEPLCTPAAMRGAIEVLTRAFPDYHLELVQAVEQGDWLAVQIHTTGTMTGPLATSMGEIPPTGKPIEQDWVAMVRFEGELIAQFDEYYDQYELMAQLGLVPGE